MSSGGAELPPDGLADTRLSGPEVPSTPTDPTADTAVALEGRPESGEPLERATLKASIKARMFPGDVEAPKIGRYAILNVLGEGGMGTVYAVFDDQLDRRVALKLIKGAGSEDARKRMLREAQAMAKLSHPNVVPVFEVGEHDGQLFVAMEYVRGVTLKRWRDDENRDWREVLGKYLQAGRGLAAAHAQGLVHRDFKPHNAVVGEDGRVRVLDFGLAAKQGEQDIAASASTILPVAKERALDTPLTETGTVMGTPAYMPPEQFMGGTVDHRSDQFSFCVALWEALYGARPFEGDGPRELFSAMAQGEFTEPGRTDVPGALREALERGLKSDTEERWPDLDGLLAELERLNVDPARARRTRRLAGGIALGGAVLVGGVLVGQDRIEAYRTGQCEAEAAAEVDAVWNGDARARVRDGLLSTGGSFAETTADKTLPWLDAYAQTWQRARAEACIDTRVRRSWTDDDLHRAQWCLQQRSMALAALVGQLRDADRTVLNEAVTAAAGLDPVDGCRDAALLKRLPTPPTNREREAVAKARQQLSNAGALGATGQFGRGLEAARAATAQARLLDRPALLAAALLTTGSLLKELGKYGEAAASFEDAYFEAVVVHDYDTAASAGGSLAFVVGYNLAKPGEGRRWARHAKVAQDELALGPDHPAVATSLNNVGGIHFAAGEYAEAKVKYERALEIKEKALGPDHPDCAYSLSSLAGIHKISGEYAEAKAKYERALAIREKALGPDHPAVATSLASLAAVFRTTGDYGRAKPLYERALAIQENALGPDHDDVAASLNSLAAVHRATGGRAEAKAGYERALAIWEASLGPNHPKVADALYNLGTLYSTAGEDARAKPLYERALAIKETALGPDHPDVAYSVFGLASVHEAAGEYGQAKSLYERSLTLWENARGPDHPDVALSLNALGNLYRTTGEDAEARASFERALAIWETALGADHPNVAAGLTNLASIHFATGEYAEARAKYERALTILEKTLGPDHADVAPPLVGLAAVHKAAGEYAEAEAAYGRALEIFEAVEGVQEYEPEAQFAAARLILRRGGELPRATARAKAAAQGYRALGKGSADALAQVEAWLVKHRGPDTGIGER